MSPLKPTNLDMYTFEAVDNRVRSNLWYHLHSMWLYREFFAYWVRRNLTVRYRQTSIGSLWAILQPLLTSLVYILVFSLILEIETGQAPYPLFITCNIVLWTYFQRVVFSGSASVTTNMDIITRVQFPREFLPLGVWAESVVDFLIGLGIIGVLFAVYEYPLTPYLLYVPVIFFVLTCFALGLMFLLAALTAIFRDLLQIIPITLQLLLYISPVIYPLHIVPEELTSLYLVNPLGPIFAGYQEALLYEKFTVGQELITVWLISMVLLYLGYMLYKRMEWKFADVL